ncbi:MAG: DUF3108 domain-containing protein [Ignavibacteriae bacterium]|nr:DUF3108 domain-containing protein [Ignavibacteriota bacterium]NOG99840.1 DUF3108 domain-containing protein [Ignavibacteriota bacterium]
MKLRIVYISAIFLALSLSLSAQIKDFRKIENNAFTVGEKLTYEVKYGFVTAGIAEMAIPKIKRISGRNAYNVVFRVNTVPAFDVFFKVRDRYETYIDVEGIFPWRFEQHIREGGFTKDFSAFFDQRRGKAKTSKGSYDIPPYVNDIFSAFYLFRTLDFTEKKKGDIIKLENFYNDKVYPLDVVYKGKETITVDAGTFDCFIVEPLVVEGGLFKSEGSITIWMTDDELKIPIRVKTKVIIGAIDSELTAYEGLAGEINSKR